MCFVWGLVSIGLALVLVGFGVVIVSLLTSVDSEHVRGKGAGVVMVGPIPIVFASDSKWASVAIALAVVLMVPSILFYVL